MKKRTLSILLAVMLVISCMFPSAVAANSTTTVMIYMCGTDIEEDGITDLKEMCRANTSSNVRIVVLAGGTKNWSDSRLINRHLNLFTISGGNWSSVTDWGQASMGSADTLQRFVSWCWNNQRSDRNVLVMWDHGSTAISGMCFDEVYNDDALTITDLETAFTKLKNTESNFHLDIIGADACLMASYEMAATLAPYADYYVASEELESYLGWYYTNWLQDLDANPSMSNKELCQSIVDSFKYGTNRDDANDYHTLSAIDLSKMSTLTSYINQLATTLAQQMNNGSLNVISRTVQSMYIFGSFDDAGSDMVDMNDFINMCSNYDSTTANNAMSTYQQAVVCNYANSYVPSATGMSIFVPMENSSDVNSSMSAYNSSAVSGYTAFVTAFAGNVSTNSWTFSANNSTPYQMGWDDYDDDFMNSAGYWWDCSDDWGCYGYGSGWGYNTSGLVIAGSNSGNGGWGGNSSSGTGGLVIAGSNNGGNTGNTGSTGSTGGLVIAGSASTGGNTTAATAAPSASTGSTGGLVIAGSTTTTAPAATTAPVVSSATAVPVAPAATTSPVTTGSLSVDTMAQVAIALAGSYTFSVKLSDDDMQHLSYAEMLLFQDFSDENGWDLDELGRVQDVWIDWNNNTVYAMFDGTWPCIGDTIVVMYEQSRTEAGRRCIIPVMLNNTTRTYLVVEYAKDSEEGRILGTSEGWGSNGLPVRGVMPLNIGDTICPIYPSYLQEDVTTAPDLNTMKSQWTVYSDYTITWDGTQVVQTGYLADLSGYQLAFRLHDIFGGETTTALTSFQLADN